MTVNDGFGRQINYIRISVTDLCNLRCFYCMPEQGICKKEHGQVLRYEEILTVVRECALLGITNVRITGGEPLVRAGIEKLIEAIRAIDGIEDISMTTNGILLKEKIKVLKAAGLDRVNISIDSLDAEKYRRITRGGDIEKVLQALDLCIELGIKPVKINAVLLKGINDDELMDFALLTEKLPVSVRFIELMPVGQVAYGFKEHYMSAAQAMDRIPGLVPADEIQSGCGPAVYYRLPGAIGTVGFIAALSHNFCKECNRIRLTADGKIKPCLNSDFEVDLKPVLRENKGSLRMALEWAIGLKPNRHHMDEGEPVLKNRDMYQIGG
jgi:cyclic pyranopterin phosphate synthase